MTKNLSPFLLSVLLLGCGMEVTLIRGVNSSVPQNPPATPGPTVPTAPVASPYHRGAIDDVFALFGSNTSSVLTSFTPDRTLYVDGGAGSDLNPGTLASPFRTIQKAADTAVAGDLVLIQGGTYRETVIPTNSGTNLKPIAYGPQSNTAVTISGSDLITDLQSATGVEDSDINSFGGESVISPYGFNSVDIDGINTVVPQSTVVAAGEKALELAFAGADKRARLNSNLDAAVDNIYARMYFRINATFSLSANDSNFDILVLKQNPSGSPVLRTSLRRNSAGNFKIYVRADLSTNTVIYSGTATEVLPDTWHRLEVRFKGNDATNGGAQVWLDGASKAGNFSLDTTGYQIGRVEFGGNSSSISTPTAGSKMFIDSMKTSTAAIGAFSPIGVAGDYVVAPFYSEPSQAFFDGVRLTPVTDQVLTNAGTFFYDADLERTYLRLPGGVSPAGHTVEIGRRQYVVQVNGKSDLWFVGLELKHADTASSGGISLHNATKILIENVRSYANFGAGVNITDYSDANVVRNCHLEDNERDFGGGVRIDTGSDENIIEHNDITGLGGNGIYIKGNVFPSARNILRYNKIDNVYDSGIYLNTDVSETQVIGNRISRPQLSLSNAAGGNGIHVAINSFNNVIKNNVVSDVQAHGIQLRQDVADNIVSNNTIYNAGLSGAGGGIYTQEGAGSAPVRNSYYNNVIHTAATGCIWFDAGSALATGINLNFNLCYNPGKPYAVTGSQNFSDVASFTSATGWDVLGLNLDPQFLDLVSTPQDLRLQTTSPAKNSTTIAN